MPELRCTSPWPVDIQDSDLQLVSIYELYLLLYLLYLSDVLSFIMYLKRFPFTLHWCKPCNIFWILYRVKCILHGVKESSSYELLLFGEEKSLAAILWLTAIEK